MSPYLHYQKTDDPQTGKGGYIGAPLNHMTLWWSTFVRLPLLKSHDSFAKWSNVRSCKELKKTYLNLHKTYRH